MNYSIKLSVKNFERSVKMLIKAIKVTKAKVFALFAAVIVIAGAIILAVPPAFAEASGDGISYKNIKTNEVLHLVFPGC